MLSLQLFSKIEMNNVLFLSSSLFLSVTRLFYMIAVFFVFRMRFYAAWCGAEAGCISAGLGCYPEKALSKAGGGPTVNYRYITTGLTSILKEDASIIAHCWSVWSSFFCC